MHIASSVTIHWYLLKLSSGNKTLDIWQAAISVKNWQNLPISNTKEDHDNINAETKFCENQLIFTQIIIRKKKIWVCCGQITLLRIDKICPLAIPNHISTISMHILSLVKIHWYLLKLSPGNENMDVLQADNSVKNWWMPTSNLKIDLNNINAYTKFGENPLIFTHYHPVAGYNIQWWHSQTLPKLIKCFFQSKSIHIFFFFLHENIHCGYLLEAPPWGPTSANIPGRLY